MRNLLNKLVKIENSNSSLNRVNFTELTEQEKLVIFNDSMLAVAIVGTDEPILLLRMFTTHQTHTQDICFSEVGSEFTVSFHIISKIIKLPTTNEILKKISKMQMNERYSLFQKCCIAFNNEMIQLEMLRELDKLIKLRSEKMGEVNALHKEIKEIKSKIVNTKDTK